MLFACFSQRYTPIILALSCLCTSAMLELKWSWTADGPISWRSALAKVRQIDPSGAAPLLIQTGYAESNLFDWQSAGVRHSYLSSPTAAYPVKNEILPLPYVPDAKSKEYLETLLTARLLHQQNIYVIAFQDSRLELSVKEGLLRHGFTATSAQDRLIRLTTFSRSH